MLISAFCYHIRWFGQWDWFQCLHARSMVLVYQADEKLLLLKALLCLT